MLLPSLGLAWIWLELFIEKMGSAQPAKFFKKLVFRKFRETELFQNFTKMSLIKCKLFNRLSI